MYCTGCGNKIEDNAQFCSDCGRKSVSENSVASLETAASPIEEIIFYSEDWQRKKTFAIAGLPYFDVMADKQYLYLIKLPTYNGSAWGLFVGLIVLNIIGAAIGSSMGSSSDTKKRKMYRSTWVDTDHKLISRDFEKNLFLKVPLNDLKGNLIMAKNKFTLTYGGKEITLKRWKKEFDRFSQYVEQYVL